MHLVLASAHLARTIKEPDMTEPAWVARARSYIGLQEKVGPLHETQVIEFFEDSGNAWVKDDETAWCGAFVSAMFVRAGRSDVRPPGEKANALRAREWLKVGTEVRVPALGDIVVFSRGSASSGQGHVGFYVGETAQNIKVLGGNQSNSVSIAQYPKSRVLGFRRVVEAAKPAPAPVQPRPAPVSPAPPVSPARPIEDFEEHLAPQPEPPLPGWLERLLRFLGLRK